MEASNRAQPRGDSPKPTEALPTRRIAFATQLDLLRAYGAAGGDGTTGVTNEALSGIVGLHAKTASLVNTFFTDVGFISRTERGNVPASEVVEFQRAYQWDPEMAARQLAPILKKSWFYETLAPKLAFNALKENAAIAALGQRANAVKYYAPELRLLLDYLDAAGLISRENGMVVAGATGEGSPSPRPATSAEKAPPSSSGASARGSLPLLIQGLLEQLPRDRRWTKAKADKWLDLARMTFDIVYDLDEGARPEPELAADDEGDEPF